MQDLAFNAMRAQNFSILANMRATNIEKDLWSGTKSITSVGNPSDFQKYNDMYKKRKALVEEAKKLGKDAIAYVAEKEGITVQGAQRYLSNKGFLDN